MRIRNKKYLKENLETLVKGSSSNADVIRKLGLKLTGGNYRHVMSYIQLYGIDTSHFTGGAWNKGERYRPICPAQPLEEILVEKSTYKSSTKLKEKLQAAELLPRFCQICKLSTWQDRPLGLHLDHINGNHIDNRIENLRILCPNCHSQTTTFSNKKRV